MRRGAWVVVALTAFSLVVAAWITASGPTPVLTTPTQANTSEPPAAESGQQKTTPRDREGKGAESGNLPLSIVITMYVLMAILAAALLLVIVSRARERRRRRLPAKDFAEPIDVDELAEGELSANLAATVSARIAAMAVGSPRNAIVRCWVELEEAVIDAGLERDPALTAAEFTREVLARLSVDQDAITVLSDLYREARFSEHDLTEEHRAAATAALHALQDQLPSPEPSHVEAT